MTGIKFLAGAVFVLAASPAYLTAMGMGGSFFVE
jgi:hypothetical protein